jgi:SET domain-containing protein
VLLVGSSSIHGCGLFTLMDLIEGQMIIEYTGEVIRPCLTDKRERENEKKVRLKYLNFPIESFSFNCRVLVVICLRLIQ